MNDVLYHLCRHCVSIMNRGLPFPSTLLSEICQKSLYQTRKELKKLKEQGYVIAGRYTENTEDGQVLLNGYIITDKAKDTEEYKKAFEEERKLCKECFDFDIKEEQAEALASASNK